MHERRLKYWDGTLSRKALGVTHSCRTEVGHLRGLIRGPQKRASRPRSVLADAPRRDAETDADVRGQQRRVLRPLGLICDVRPRTTLGS